MHPPARAYAQIVAGLSVLQLWPPYPRPLTEVDFLSAVAEKALTPCPLSHARRENAAPKARAGEGVNPKNGIGGERSSPPIPFFGRN